jgi:hypothetical protein
MTSLSQKINEVNERVDNITTQVCFIVSRGGQTVVNTNTILPYDNKSENIGGGFDSNTYTFTCPIQGRYIFSTGFHTNGNNSYAVDLKINHQSHVSSGRAGTGASGSSKKVIVAIAVLNVGDTVYAECVSGAIRLFGQNVSRFYGCLLE